MAFGQLSEHENQLRYGFQLPKINIYAYDPVVNAEEIEGWVFHSSKRMDSKMPMS